MYHEYYIPMHMYRPGKEVKINLFSDMVMSERPMPFFMDILDGLYPVTDGCPWPTEDSAMA